MPSLIEMEASSTASCTLSASRHGRSGLRTIYEISKLLASSLDLTKSLNGVLNLLSVNLDTWRGMIFLEEEPGELRLVASNGVPPEHLRDKHFLVGEGITGKIFKTACPVSSPMPRLNPCSRTASARWMKRTEKSSPTSAFRSGRPAQRWACCRLSAP